MFSLNVTESAQLKLKEILSEEEACYLRVFSTGGGCSGMQYGLTFEDYAEEDDIQFHSGDVVFLIDPISSIYLNDGKIDYVEEIMRSEFVITCESVNTSCGCGSST